MSESDENDDMSDWTPEQREEWRLNELCDPLFQMLLDFRDAFAAKAVDELDVTDEDAEKMACLMLRSGESGLAVTFAALPRHIQSERASRKVSHMVSAVWAAKGKAESIALVDVHAEYDKLPKGTA